VPALRTRVGAQETRDAAPLSWLSDPVLEQAPADGVKPIHIMRWAPADYLDDEFVKGAYLRRDYRTVAFYSAFLFRAWLKGGSLPSQPSRLAVELLMPEKDCAAGAKAAVDAGKLVERDGALYHPRSLREMEEARAFSEEQAARGRAGGSKRTLSGGQANAKQTLQEPEANAKPSVAVAVASSLMPMPLPLPERSAPANPLVAGRRPDLETEALRLVREIATQEKLDPEEVMRQASKYEGSSRSKLNPASMTDDRLLNTVMDLRGWRKALAQKEAM
jgi:hypothetical protein